MARFNTDVLKLQFNAQNYDPVPGTYSGDYTAKLGCAACSVSTEIPIHWPPEGYDGPPATSPQMLDDNAWVLAGSIAAAECSHVDLSASLTE